MMFFRIFALAPTFIVIPILIRVTFFTITFTFICFNVFDLFIPVIMMNTLKSPVLFGTHTLLDRSLRVLKLLTNLSKLTENEY